MNTDESGEGPPAEGESATTALPSEQPVDEEAAEKGIADEEEIEGDEGLPANLHTAFRVLCSDHIEFLMTI